MPNEVIIPDEGNSRQEIKLNLKNMFTFLSSLDYIKTLEMSSALKSIDSGQLYFVGERQSVFMFVFTHASFIIMFAYLFIIISAQFILGINPVYAVLGISIGYLLSGIWFVNRYTYGDGYLYQVVRDFMTTLTIATFSISLATDIFLYYILPSLYYLAINWLSSGNDGTLINQIGYIIIKTFIDIINPIMTDYLPYVNKYLSIYLMLSPLKIISFIIPTILMLYLHRVRKNPKKMINKILVKIA